MRLEESDHANTRPEIPRAGRELSLAMVGVETRPPPTLGGYKTESTPVGVWPTPKKQK